MEHHQPPHVLARRDVLNMHWPPDPAAFRRHDKGIAVRVRIVWDRDGEEYVEGVATRWDAHTSMSRSETSGFRATVYGSSPVTCTGVHPNP